MIKKKKFLIPSIILLCLLIGILVFYMGSSKDEEPLVTLNNKGFEKHIKEKDDMWVYIGRPTCEECQRFSPVLKEVLKENDKNIYYYNTDEAAKENEQEMVTLLNKLEVKIVPTLISFKDGKVKETVEGYQGKSSLEKLLKE